MERADIFKDFTVTLSSEDCCVANDELERAVIDFSEDISTLMPDLCRVIDGCAYDPVRKKMAFRAKGMGVVVEPRRISITDAGNTAAAIAVIEWLRDRLENPPLRSTV